MSSSTVVILARTLHEVENLSNLIVNLINTPSSNKEQIQRIQIEAENVKRQIISAISVVAEQQEQLTDLSSFNSAIDNLITQASAATVST